jgi:hypothetical protein
VTLILLTGHARFEGIQPERFRARANLALTADATHCLGLASKSDLLQLPATTHCHRDGDNKRLWH